MNKTILVGRIAKDIDLKQNSEMKVARTSIAVQREFKDKKTGEYGADFINLVAFGHNAEFISKYFSKGQKIGIVGHIQTGSYEDKNGQKKYTFDVIVDSSEFVESKNSGNQNNSVPQEEPATDNDGFMNIPDDIPEELPLN